MAVIVFTRFFWQDRAELLLTPIGTGIVLQSFRLQGHELFREGSRFFAGYAVDERDYARDELMP
jgi:hypothetical protein